MKKMRIICPGMDYVPAHHYELQTFTEKRETSWTYAPHKVCFSIFISCFFCFWICFSILFFYLCFCFCFSIFVFVRRSKLFLGLTFPPSYVYSLFNHLTGISFHHLNNKIAKKEKKRKGKWQIWYVRTQMGWQSQRIVKANIWKKNPKILHIFNKHIKLIKQRTSCFKMKKRGGKMQNAD